MKLVELKKRIMKEAKLVKVQTVFGTAVTVSKVAACQMLDVLDRRGVDPHVSFTEIGTGKQLVIIDEERKVYIGE